MSQVLRRLRKPYMAYVGMFGFWALMMGASLLHVYVLVIAFCLAELACGVIFIVALRSSLKGK
jgi:hypothetical protein